ncbi:HNH endonuclease [Chryseobacterium bernardetii]|uniref:HNH endonuclease n=1 Tax=Chryseobacterium bernardetii TaxID=1241978 RepID=UPI000F4F599A|nr:HNH endonuclease [Chryseobacterium bernardetii]AZB33994.1 HNH endonuclease [Chryseobacterium bernardetii]
MSLIFDEQDLNDIAIAEEAGGKIWYNSTLDRLKRKIKDSFTNCETAQCCYCARLFKGEFNMVIDLEHVLPQEHYSTERFNLNNLNIACKRCNMEIKKSDTSFIANKVLMGTNYYDSIHYKIVHPNLDTYANHIIIKQMREGDLILYKYICKDKQKGKYTYDYFKLNELEIDTINEAQGIKQTIKTLFIPENFRRRFLQLLTKI